MKCLKVIDDLGHCKSRSRSRSGSKLLVDLCSGILFAILGGIGHSDCWFKVCDMKMEKHSCSN